MAAKRSKPQRNYYAVTGGPSSGVARHTPD